MILRPATRQDFERYYGKKPPMTLRAIVAEQDGKLIGIGGYFLRNDVAIAFTDQRGMTRRQMVFAGHVVNVMLRRLRIGVVATCGPEGDAAMRHFGFEPWGSVWRLA